MSSIYLKGIIKIVVPIQGLLSVYFLLKGHHLPGGGFIGGLIAASALVFYLLVFEKIPKRFNEFYVYYLVLFGLFCSFLAGGIGLIKKGSFLSAVWGPELFVPGIGLVNFSSVFLFDLGVYLLVAGLVFKLMLMLKKENNV